MFNVRLAGGHLYGKKLFTWLSLVVSFMASFLLSFFPLDVLDGIWDLIESVSVGFLTYSCFLSGDLMHFVVVSSSDNLNNGHPATLLRSFPSRTKGVGVAGHSLSCSIRGFRLILFHN